ncbi:hypothetical protein evm_005671 [Chilo suppressalis]|nr:hypothetical protein evm_005671 [Chilo suppressalis]
MRLRTALFLLIIPMVLSRHRTRRTEDDMLLFWRRSSAAKCEPFTTFMSECNKCVCAADSISYCTKMNCHKVTEKPDDVYVY